MPFLKNVTGYRFSAESFIAWTTFFISVLFFIWTVIHHLSTFVDIKWNAVVHYTTFCLPLIIFLAGWIALSFTKAYIKEIVFSTIPNENKDSSFSISFALGITLFITFLFLLPDYSLKYIFTCLIFLVLIYWSKYHRNNLLLNVPNDKKILSASNRTILLTIFLLIIIAEVVTLLTNRSDFDDAEYIQTALQTMLYPDRAILSFDASLGVILDSFRFAPYRIASYETLVALITSWTGIDLLTVYYLVLPAFSAAITVLVGYLFARWFLPSRLALIATGIFLLIMFSWGDTHVAYGNRVFVRLFQGKGLLIALTTPLTLITGLLYIRSPSISRWVFLIIAQVITLGVSSTGLILSFATTLLLLPIAFQWCNKKSLMCCLTILLSLSYSAIIGVWLKFSTISTLAMNLVGTDLPINASLGLKVHEVITLTLLVAGFFLLRSRMQRKEFLFLSAGILFFILNPLVAEIIANYSSRNMNWRLAWAAPVPLMLSVALAAGLSSFFTYENVLAANLRSKKHSAGIFSIVILMVFLIGGRWVISPNNNVTWDWFSIKVPQEYYASREISEVLDDIDITGTVLSVQRIGTWLTVTSPDLKHVMPGHGFPICLKTILTESDYNNRIKLLALVELEDADYSNMYRLIQSHDVQAVVLKNDAISEKFLTELSFSRKILIEKSIKIGAYRVLKITYPKGLD
ncbi:MAG: DUF6077 domain-containing protein [Gammaproteobacteria bacterium]